MTERKQRPGIVLYFDTLCPAIARLPNDQCGELLKSIIQYALTGEIPILDGMTGMAFDLLRPGIDRDGERYERQKIHGQYMAYCRSAKERGETPVTEEEYRLQLVVTVSNCKLPTTNTDTNASTHTNTNAPASRESNSYYDRIPSNTNVYDGSSNKDAGGKSDEQRFEERRAALQKMMDSYH